MLKVESFREFPSGLFPGIHKAIIDKDTWRLVQNKINEPKRTKIILDEQLPLRGILKCHCRNPLTGAPSRGKSAKYFYYYKCKYSGHNNLSAIKIHDQFVSILELLNLPEKMINEIIRGCHVKINKEVKSKRLKIITQENQLKDVERKLSALEEKWIVDEINKTSFGKWYIEYNEKIIKLKKSIDKLNYIVDKVTDILEQKLDLLIDVKHIFNQGTLLQKKELIKILFDNNLY